MSDPFLCEIRIVAFNFAPRGWALCNGQTLPINQNQALFSLVGTMYGGNGTTSFQLPNLQGRMPMHFANAFTQGQSDGSESQNLTVAQLPTHNHALNGTTATGNLAAPGGNFLASSRAHYAETPDTQLATNSVGFTGSGLPHENRPPFLVLNFVIALQGIYPSRN